MWMGPKKTLWLHKVALPVLVTAIFRMLARHNSFQTLIVAERSEHNSGTVLSTYHSILRLRVSSLSKTRDLLRSIVGYLD
jgi:hypothetical protein